VALSLFGVGAGVKTTQLMGLLASSVLAAGMWTYFERVLVAHQISAATSRGVPRGNLSDLYPRWLGARELLLKGRDPYAADITREMQAGYYGRPLDPFRPADPHDQQAFAYPVYVVFLLAPTIKLPFSEVQQRARWLFAGLAVVGLLLWLRILRWRPSAINLTTMVLLLLSTVGFVQAIKLQQLSLFVAALMTVSVYLLARNLQVPAGLVLAFATVKPHVALPLCAWLLLWSIASLRSRWKFLASFLGTMSCLIVGGEFLLPGWIGKFRAAVVAYRSYTEGGTLLGGLLTPTVGAILTVLVGIALATICYRLRTSLAETREFACIASLVLATTVVLLPTVAPYNQLLLLPGALLLVQSRNQTSRPTRFLIGIAAACLLWPWLAATTLAAMSLFTIGAQRFWDVPLWTSITIPISITACLFLITPRKQPQRQPS
jgi:hypothetical protein